MWLQAFFPGTVLDSPVKTRMNRSNRWHQKLVGKIEILCYELTFIQFVNKKWRQQVDFMSRDPFALQITTVFASLRRHYRLGKKVQNHSGESVHPIILALSTTWPWLNWGENQRPFQKKKWKWSAKKESKIELHHLIQFWKAAYRRHLPQVHYYYLFIYFIHL